jgi:dihydrolipoamide dehydrogenase
MHAPFNVDVAIIGAGTAGLLARRAALAEGARVLLCDPGPYGTTCARAGCMPSKLLIAAANAARGAGQAHGFGVHAGGVAVDGAAVMARVRRERDDFVHEAAGELERLGPNELLRERVRFVGPTTLASERVRRVDARAVVIATGSRPFIPPALAGLSRTLRTSETIFDLETVPARLAVVGAGVLGLELAQAMAALGAEVTLLDAKASVGPLTDPDVAATLFAYVSREVALQLGVTLLAAREEGPEAFLEWRQSDGSTREGRFDAVLAAAGRTPNLDGLALSDALVPLGPDGRLPVNPHTLQVGSAPLFAAGDASGLKPLLHEAADEGRIAGRNAADFARVGPLGVHRWERRTPLTIAFTNPQLAMGGLTRDEAGGDDAVCGVADFAHQGRARIDREAEGLLKIYGEPATGRLTGFEMAGPAAEHLGHLLAWAIQGRLTVLEALERPFYHPVVEEGVRTALRDLARNLGLDRGPGLRLRAPVAER